jgi:hypothetical protein
MAIRIVTRRGRVCPRVFCDHCGGEISRGRNGNYQWREPAGELFFTHKACSHDFENDRGGDWLAFELEALPHFLANNLGVKQREVFNLLRLVEMVS